jgi:ABC-type long-subunit fatty acid transport system fused permease/ATPase subunit
VVVMVMINTFLVKKYIFATQMNNVYLPSWDLSNFDIEQVKKNLKF